VGEDAVGRIEEIVKAESGRLEELESDNRLVHGDFNPTNVLINKRAGSWTGSTATQARPTWISATFSGILLLTTMDR